jgi:hypothetical protein
MGFFQIVNNNKIITVVKTQQSIKSCFHQEKIRYLQLS